MAPIIWDQNAVQHVLTLELSIASVLLIVFTGVLFFWLKYLKPHTSIEPLYLGHYTNRTLTAKICTQTHTHRATLFRSPHYQ